MSVPRPRTEIHLGMPLLSPALPLLSPQTDGQKRRYSK
jgi:hypothetical protein